MTGQGEEGFAAKAAGELHFGDADVGRFGGGIGGVKGGGDGGGFDDGQGFDVRAGAGFAAEGRVASGDAELHMWKNDGFGTPQNLAAQP